MVSHEDFGRLRLHSLLPEEVIWEIQNYELFDRLWIAEGFNAFTTIARLVEDPEVSRVMEVCFTELQPEQATRLMKAVGLELSEGMCVEEIVHLLGRPTREVLKLEDRSTLEFEISAPEPYQVACTVLHSGGLLFVTVNPPLPPIGCDYIEA